MMAPGLTCPDCGSSGLVEDDLYSQCQLVCSDCGSVVSEGQFTATRSEEQQGTVVRYYESTEVAKYPCKNQVKGLKRVRALCRILRFPAVIEESAERLFSQAYQHPRFLHVSLQKKEALAGSCVLLSCRLHSVAVTMGTVTALMDVDPSLVGRVFKAMVKTLQIEIPSSSIFDLLEGHCGEYHLSATDVPEEYCESTSRLAEQASALLELASTTWLVTGRHPVPMLKAAVYLAWLSLKPCPARLRFSLARFCQMAKVSAPRPAAKRVEELKEVLCQLGQELPWQRGEVVAPRNVAALVNDILKHRLTLLKQSMQRQEDELNKESAHNTETLPIGHCPGEEAHPIGPTQMTQAPPRGHVSNTGDPAADSVPCFSDRSPYNQKANSVSGSVSKSVSEFEQAVPVLESTEGAVPDVETAALNTAEHWGKRPLFTPPCVRHSSKKARLAQSPVAVTGDEDILDSEIDEYIRTPVEVRELLELQLGLGLG